MKEDNEYLSTLQSKNESLNSQLQDPESQLSEYKTNDYSVSRIVELNRKAKEAEKQKDVVKYELKQAKQNIVKLKQEIELMGDLKEESQTMKDQQEEFEKKMKEIEKENTKLEDQVRLLENKQDVEVIGVAEEYTLNSAKDNFEQTINDLSVKLKECEQRSNDLENKLKPFEDKEITVDKFTEQSDQIIALQNDFYLNKTKIDEMEVELSSSQQTNNKLKEENRVLLENLEAFKNEKAPEEDTDIGNQGEAKEDEAENFSEHIASENHDGSVPEGPKLAIEVHSLSSKPVNLKNLASNKDQRTDEELKQNIEIEEITEDYFEELKKFEEKEKGFQEIIQKLTEELDEEKAIKEKQLEEQHLNERNINGLNQKIEEMKTEIIEKTKNIGEQLNIIKKLNDDIKELNQEKQTIQKDLEDQKTINTNTLNESKKEKDKSQKEIDKLYERIAQLKDKLNKYSETLENSSSSYLKYSKISKNFTETLSAQEQKYTDLKKRTREVIRRLENTKLKREEDIEAYSKLRVEHLKLKESFDELLDKDKTDTAEFNKMRLCFEGFVRNIGEENNSLCEGFEYIISENKRIANEFRSETESKIESYNQEIDQRWKNNVNLNLQNVKFIYSLKNTIQEINEKSKDDIQNSSKDLLYLSEEVKEELNTLKDKYPLIEQGYEHFLLQNKNELNKIKEEITTQEDLIHDVNIKIQNHNKDIKTIVQQEKEKIEIDIDILKNKLSALKFVINHVNEKLNQSELLECETREMNIAYANTIILRGRTTGDLNIFSNNHFCFSQGCKINFIRKNDLGSFTSDAISIPLNEKLNIYAQEKVYQNIRSKSGLELEAACTNYLATQGKLPIGSSIVLPCSNLKFKKIIGTIVPSDKGPIKFYLKKCLLSTLDKIVEHDFASTVIPTFHVAQSGLKVVWKMFISVLLKYISVKKKLMKGRTITIGKLHTSSLAISEAEQEIVSKNLTDGYFDKIREELEEEKQVLKADFSLTNQKEIQCDETTDVAYKYKSSIKEANKKYSQLKAELEQIKNDSNEKISILTIVKERLEVDYFKLHSLNTKLEAKIESLTSTPSIPP
ncbi:unnamed protein product [Moneuplotes crassus]|uniref:Macro domain-containing protein n=1 Tax=Euplotes crassus TaxID=5936 RepID=A0AAD1U9E4_EUPCR|nr:unnamed protein product [Moneuplotes crassus]